MPTLGKPAATNSAALKPAAIAPTAFGPATTATSTAMFTLGRGWHGLPNHAAHGQDGRKQKVNHAAGAA